jgi:uncharacterized protein YcfL
MKKITTAVLILISCYAFGQDTTYNDIIKFNISDSVENDIVFKRKAFFEAMIYNQRAKSVTLQFTINFYAGDGIRKMKGFKSYTKEISIKNEEYVISSTGVFVGDISQVLQLYGKPTGNTENPYIKLPDGRYDLTIQCMTHYDFFVKEFDLNKKLHAAIRAAGILAASEGKLN